MSASPSPVVAGLSAIADRYDAFILDLWGCIHNGIEPYPGVLDALQRLRAAGKKLLVLSNAPRRADVVAGVIDRMGIPPSLFDAVMSSGEATWQALATRDDPWHARLGKSCLHVGPARDISLYEGNGLTLVKIPAEADFVLMTGPTDDSLGLDAHEDLLRACLARKLPMVCANPDLEVMKGEQWMICAGALALRYEEMGGDVRQHGKPYPDIYVRSLALLGNPDRSRTLGVGDSLRTDIAVAAAAGIHSLLISGGIHGREFGVAMGETPDPAKLAAWLAKAAVKPTYIAPGLRW